MNLNLGDEKEIVLRRRRAPMHAASPPNAPRYRVMFTVPFQTAMSDSDAHRLNSVLGMSMHLRPKLRSSPASPGVSRLDFVSGLFLLRGERPGDWRLEGRTWGAPAPETVHGWHLVAAAAARLVDPGVPVPPRLAAAELRTAPGPRPRRRRRRHSRL